jgi:hypothetical protein
LARYGAYGQVISNFRNLLKITSLIVVLAMLSAAVIALPSPLRGKHPKPFPATARSITSEIDANFCQCYVRSVSNDWKPRSVYGAFHFE